MWTIANLLTIFRVLLIPPFLGAIATGRYEAALAIFFVASATDMADGYVARRFHQQTNFGRILDPIADKALTTSAYITMAIPHRSLPSIPLWLVLVVIGRDVLILGGSAALYLIAAFKDFKPSIAGKVNTMLELGLILVFLAAHAWEGLSFLRTSLPVCYVMVAAGVAVSSAVYVVKGLSILRRRPPNQALV